MVRSFYNYFTFNGFFLKLLFSKAIDGISQKRIDFIEILHTSRYDWLVLERTCFSFGRNLFYTLVHGVDRNENCTFLHSMPQEFSFHFFFSLKLSFKDAQYSRFSLLDKPIAGCPGHRELTFFESFKRKA